MKLSGRESKPNQEERKERHCRPHRYNAETNTGRWKYLDKIGEGSYGVCWKVLDMEGNYAIPVVLKVSKYQQMSAQCFMLHREATFSMRRIHCKTHKRYKKAKAELFVQYLEDHTSFRSETAGQDTKKEMDCTLSWVNTKIEEGSSISDDDVDYVVMEFCEGCPLRKVLRCRALTVKTSRQIVAECCSALEYLFELELVHRDFRPANLLWTGSKLKVLDFGLMLPHRATMIRNTSVVNNVPVCSKNYWMPPEVQLGRQNFGAKRWSFDVFSLGSIVYEICLPRLASGSGEELTKFYKTLTDPHDPHLPEVSAFWRGLGVVDDFVPSMLHPQEASRPRPAKIRKLMETGLDSQIASLFDDGRKIRTAEQKACSFCGALHMLTGMHGVARKQMLTKMCKWLNEGGPKSWLYAYRRLEELVQRGDSVVASIYEEMTQMSDLDQNDLAVKECFKELEDSKRKVVDLLSTATDSMRTCISTTVGTSSSSTAKVIFTDIDRVDPSVEVEFKRQLGMSTTNLLPRATSSTSCKEPNPTPRTLCRTLTGSLSCATPSSKPPGNLSASGIPPCVSGLSRQQSLSVSSLGMLSGIPNRRRHSSGSAQKRRLDDAFLSGCMGSKRRKSAVFSGESEVEAMQMAGQIF